MRRGRGSLALALGVAACLGACLVAPKDTPFDIEIGIAPFQIDVRVQNQGDGFGKVVIAYFELVGDVPQTVGVTVPFPCTAVLGSGASCVQVVELQRSLGVALEAEAEPNSKFQGWNGGDCTIPDPDVVECLIDPAPFSPGGGRSEYVLRIRFDLR